MIVPLPNREQEEELYTTTSRLAGLNALYFAVRAKTMLEKRPSFCDMANRGRRRVSLTAVAVAAVDAVVPARPRG